MMWWMVALAGAGELSLEMKPVDFLLPQNMDRALVPVLTRLHAMHEDWLGSSLPSLVPLEVRLIRDSTIFKPVVHSHEGETATRVGYYERQEHRVTVWYRSEQEAREVLLHETGHYLSHLAGRINTPKWLREGIAELGATAVVDSDGRVWLTPNPGRMASLERRVRPAASALIGLDEAVWSTLGVSPEYPYGWALCYFLLATDERRPTLAALLSATAGSPGPGVAALAAVEEHYPGGLAAFDQDFARWRPSRIELPPRFAGPASNGWSRCQDGSLVRLDAGGRCARWVAGPDGVMRYVEEDPLP